MNTTEQSNPSRKETLLGNLSNAERAVIVPFWMQLCEAQEQLDTHEVVINPQAIYAAAFRNARGYEPDSTILGELPTSLVTRITVSLPELSPSVIDTSAITE